MADKSLNQLPFNEAIDFFKKKIALPSAGWTDIWAQQHSLAFVVAGAQSDALLADFYTALKQAQQQGTGYAVFKSEFKAIVAKHKWAYKGQEGWRSRIIYQTNMNQAYNAGRWQQMWALRELRPYLRYRHTTIENPRLSHKAWDGKVLAIDDPWWHTHYPQNAWGCKCRVDSLSPDEAQADWAARGRSGPDEAPPLEWEEVKVGQSGANPRTVRTPKGVSPGFAYNPGRAYLEPHTVPPMQGYEAVFTQRARAAADGPRPAMPAPKVVPEAILNPPELPLADAVQGYLEVFGASMDKAAVFEDVTGARLVVSRALFGTPGPQGMDFAWLAARKAKGEDLNLLAFTLVEPDEVWMQWEPDAAGLGQWRLRRRYLKRFEVAGQAHPAVAAFEWGADGWRGRATFEAESEKVFNELRAGRLVYESKGGNE